jgi:hypothetical protein
MGSTKKNCSTKKICNYFFFILISIIICISIYSLFELDEIHLTQDPVLFNLKKLTSPLHAEIKNLKLYKSDKSYTINKKKIYLCLKDENGKYYPTNQLVYVFLHEFAHYLNKEDIGHTQTFHDIFQDLLKKAEENGIYNPNIPMIENYCNF